MLRTNKTPSLWPRRKRPINVATFQSQGWSFPGAADALYAAPTMDARGKAPMTYY